MSFTPPQPYVPNNPLTLSKNLRFVTPGGNPITRQFPDEYITNIGDTLSIQIDNYNLILTSLNNTNEEVIPAMQTQINQILTSGAIAIPNVSAGCLATSGTGSLPMYTVVSLLVSNSCAYNNIFGPVSALAQAVATQCANLNTAPAFSQNSAMAGLPGWKSSPITVSDTINNEWLTICDSRAGITKALNTITPACSQVTIAFVAQIPDFMTGFNFWFEGYTFVPTGFADGGSTIIITDGMSGIITQPVNIITLSTTPGAYNIVTSGSTLSPTAEQYTVTLNTNVSNSSAGITCQKTTLGVTGSPVGIPFGSILASNPGPTPNPVTPGCGTCLPATRYNVDLQGLSSGSTVLTYTPPLSASTYGTFHIPGYYNILSITGYTLQLYASFTDENNVIQTVQLVVTSTLGFGSRPGLYARIKLGTLITLYTVLLGSGSISYDIGDTVIQVA